MISAAYAAEGSAHAVPFYADPTFWVAMAFIVVVGLAIRPVLRAVTAGLDSRAEGIKSKLDEARRLREDAQALLAEYQRKQRDALQEAEGIVAHARSEAERMKKEAKAQLEASVKRREQQAQQRIEQAEQQAIAQVRNLAVDIAMQATAKVISERMTAEKANALIDESIQILPEKLH